MEIEAGQHARGSMLRQDMTMDGGTTSLITDRASGKTIAILTQS